MDYKTKIGQKIIRYDGVNGILSEVNEHGFIKADFEDDLFGGYFMFDPFLDGRFKFADPSLQKEIDDKIAEMRREEEKLIQSTLAASPDKEKYYVTLKNEDGTLEKVLSLDCAEEEARMAFCYVVRKQQGIQRRNQGANFKWRIVELWDVNKDHCIARES